MFGEENETWILACTVFDVAEWMRHSVFGHTHRTGAHTDGGFVHRHTNRDLNVHGNTLAHFYAYTNFHRDSHTDSHRDTYRYRNGYSYANPYCRLALSGRQFA